MRKIIKKFIARLRVPKGPYCNNCPYWRPNIAPIKIGDRTIAYCKYLDKTDLDIYKERANRVVTDAKTGKEYFSEEFPPCFASLLWDGCKECGINEE